MVKKETLLPYDSQADAEKEIQQGQDAAERAQMRTLETEAGFREAHVEREKQRMALRGKAYEHSVAVCLGLAVYLGVMAFVIAMSEAGVFSPEAQIAIFATPVVALAAITIFILRGVFSGFSEKTFSEDAQIISQFTNGTNS